MDTEAQPLAFKLKWTLHGADLLAHAPRAGLFLARSQRRPSLRRDLTGELVRDFPEFLDRGIRGAALGETGRTVLFALSSPDELVLLKLDADGRVLETQREPLPFPPIGMAMLPGEKVGVAWDKAGLVARIGEVRGLLHTLDTLEDPDGPNFAQCFPERGLFAGGGGNIWTCCPSRVWDLVTGESWKPAWDLSWAQAVAFSPDGSKVAMGARQRLSVFDEKSGETLQEWWDEAGFSPMSVRRILWSKDGKHLYTVSRSDQVHFVQFDSHFINRLDPPEKGEPTEGPGLHRRSDLRFSTYDECNPGSAVTRQDQEQEVVIWPTLLRRLRRWTLGEPWPRTLLDQVPGLEIESPALLENGLLACRLKGHALPWTQPLGGKDAPDNRLPVQVRLIPTESAPEDPWTKGIPDLYPFRGQDCTVEQISPWVTMPGNPGILAQLDGPEGQRRVSLLCQSPVWKWPVIPDHYD